MNPSTIAKWAFAAIVFMAIGVVDMRYGHVAGLAALVLILVGVFVLDTRARRAELGRAREQGLGQQAEPTEELAQVGELDEAPEPAQDREQDQGREADLDREPDQDRSDPR